MTCPRSHNQDAVEPTSAGISMPPYLLAKVQLTLPLLCHCRLYVSLNPGGSTIVLPGDQDNMATNKIVP